jgi:hypothetical protein
VSLVDPVGTGASVCPASTPACSVGSFELEQGVCFPALHGVAPAWRADLERLEREHAGLLATLRELTAWVESAPAHVSQAALEQWLAGLRDQRRQPRAAMRRMGRQGAPPAKDVPFCPARMDSKRDATPPARIWGLGTCSALSKPVAPAFPGQEDA